MNKMQTQTNAWEGRCASAGDFPALWGLPCLCRRSILMAGCCLLSVLVLLAGCSKESMPGPAEEGGNGTAVPVSFEIEGLSELVPQTKASLATNTTVRVVAYKANASNPVQANYVADQAYYWNGSKLVPCTVDVNGKKTADAANQTMMIQSGSYDFYAVSPALPLASNKTTLSTAVDNGMDYATTTTKKNVTIPAQTAPYALTLNQLMRQCARIRLVVRPQDQTVKTLTINATEIGGLAGPQEITVGSASTAASTGTQNLLLSSADFSVSGTTCTSDFCVLPLNNATLSFAFDVLQDGDAISMTGELPVPALNQGTMYTISATISESSMTDGKVDITFSAGWDTSTDNNPNLGSYPYVLNGNTIVSKDLYGYTGSYGLHEPWTVTPAHSESAWDANASGYNTVGGRFEVASANAGSTTWDNVKTVCANYSQSSGGTGTWRVPTIRELQLIWSLQKKLTKCEAPSLGSLRWSATESDSNTAWWGHRWGGGFDIKASNKSIGANVLCVRDF